MSDAVFAKDLEVGDKVMLLGEFREITDILQSDESALFYLVCLRDNGSGIYLRDRQIVLAERKPKPEPKPYPVGTQARVDSAASVIMVRLGNGQWLNTQANVPTIYSDDDIRAHVAEGRVTILFTPDTKEN